MLLSEILFTQGFGTRRLCAGLVQNGLVSIDGQLVTESDAEFEPQGLHFTVQGIDWCYAEKAYIVLNKPQGTEVSQKPTFHPSVYSLLPTPLRMRPSQSAVQGVQAVGRLDQDTTGLLLMSDDGKFIHRMSSPKHNVPKVYEVTTKHAVDDKQIAKLLAGVVLDDSPVPVKASACELVSDTQLKLTLTQGKYHQVKRMLAAVSNRVEGLHRSQMGAYTMPSDLAPGQWCWLSADDLNAIGRK